MKHARTIIIVFILFQFITRCSLPERIDEDKRELFGSWTRSYRHDIVDVTSSEPQGLLKIHGKLSGYVSFSGTYNHVSSYIDQHSPGEWAHAPGIYFLSSPDQSYNSPFLYINTYADSITSYAASCENSWGSTDCNYYKPDSTLDFVLDFNSGELSIPPTYYYNDDKSDSLLVRGLLTLEVVNLPADSSTNIEILVDEYTDHNPLWIDFISEDECCAEYSGISYGGTYCTDWGIDNGVLDIHESNVGRPVGYYYSYSLASDTLELLASETCYDFSYRDYVIAEHPNILTTCETTKLGFIRQ